MKREQAIEIARGAACSCATCRAAADKVVDALAGADAFERPANPIVTAMAETQVRTGALTRAGLLNGDRTVFLGEDRAQAIIDSLAAAGFTIVPLPTIVPNSAAVEARTYNTERSASAEFAAQNKAAAAQRTAPADGGPFAAAAADLAAKDMAVGAMANELAEVWTGTPTSRVSGRLTAMSAAELLNKILAAGLKITKCAS